MAFLSLLLWGTSSAHLIGNWLMIHPGQAWPRWWVKAAHVWWVFINQISTYDVWYMSVMFLENRGRSWVYGKHMSVSEITKYKYSSLEFHSKCLNLCRLNSSFPPCLGWRGWVNPHGGKQQSQAPFGNLFSKFSEAYSKPTQNQVDSIKLRTGPKKGQMLYAS